MTNRCAWCGTDPLYTAYHDLEWGVPNHDDRHLFEMLVLEGAQAGLSWITILRKRENYRRAFADFDADKVARYTSADVERLMADAGIVRNRLKIESAIANARATLEAQTHFGSLDALLWKFVDGVPRDGGRRMLADVPAETVESKAMSRELKRLGFRFVGPTVCYAFMQAVGMVNDHVVDCFRHREIAAGLPLTSPPPRP
ncbi:MAG: DNA-3-methyladenine glycosylase I [Thauera sp.]|nr:DNA-3-methyladenine glycosylase I [Thauera sp.]